MSKKEISDRTVMAIHYLLENQEGLTKSTLAERCGIKPAKFSEILNKRMMAGTDIMGVLADQFNISAEWLLTGHGTMNQPNNADTVVGYPLRTDRILKAQNIPLYSFDATAGLVAIFNQQYTEPEDYISIPDIPPVD